MGIPSTPEAPDHYAWLPVLLAAGTLAAALTVLSTRYGYHRDELYFRLLPTAWGYLDQPPLTPALARLSTGVADELWALRLPATLLAAGSVLVLALVTREVGGGRLAQGIAAWGYAFGTMTLSFGHVLLTSSLDLVVWPAVLLAALRAVRRDPRWWLLAGTVVGFSTYNKWLITMLVISVLAGLALVGPRRALRSRWLLISAGLAVLIALPNIGWQLRHGLPQLAMGGALSAANGTEVRISTIPMLLVMIGPLLMFCIVAGLVRLIRDPHWRDLRFVAVALAVCVGATIAGGAQFYYPYGVLAVVFALGCVPVARYAQGSARRRLLVLGLVGLHVVTNTVISLPVLPEPVLAASPIPSLNQSVGDQVGWPAYVERRMRDELQARYGIDLNHTDPRAVATEVEAWRQRLEEQRRAEATGQRSSETAERAEAAMLLGQAAQEDRSAEQSRADQRQTEAHANGAQANDAAGNPWLDPGQDREAARDLLERAEEDRQRARGSEARGDDRAGEAGLYYDSAERRAADARALEQKGIDPEVVASRMRADTNVAKPATLATAGAGRGSRAPKARKAVSRGAQIERPGVER